MSVSILLYIYIYLYVYIPIGIYVCMCVSRSPFSVSFDASQEELNLIPISNILTRLEKGIYRTYIINIDIYIYM